MVRKTAKNQVVKPLAIQVAPPAPLPAMALEGEIIEPQGFEPIPHNDQKAIADAVNHLVENSDPDRVVSLEREVSSLTSRVEDLEEKLQRFTEAFGDPDSEAANSGADKGADSGTDKH